MGALWKRGNVWWVRYYRDGIRREESARTSNRKVALDLLHLREGEVAKGVPIEPANFRLTFQQATADLLNDYAINQRKTLDEAKRRLRKHLLPYFGSNTRLSDISSAHVRAYIVRRKASTEVIRAAHDVKRADGSVRHVPEHRRAIDGVSNGEINRELTVLKRLFTLAFQTGKLLSRPHIPMLREQNTRVGFFTAEQFESVRSHLPADLQPLVTFGWLTGWRIHSEALPLTWAQVDFVAGVVRLEPHTTKNDEARQFPMTSELRQLLQDQRTRTDELQKQLGTIIPWVFYRLVAKGRRGPKSAKRIIAFGKAWKAACRAAGCPGRIPHDLRRSAVRNLVRAGIPERVAMQMSGHKTRSVFERYNIVSEGDFTDAARKLDAAKGKLATSA